MKKQGFTLAEVLVTLIIIGVIASITVPSLKRGTEEQANVAAVKKAYATISSATRILRTEQGPTKMWDLSAESVAAMYRTKMNAMDNDTAAYPTTYLNGQQYKNDNMFLKTAATPDEEAPPATSFMTADGALYYVQSTDPSCTTNNPTWSGCINLGVDINGSKGPNRVGVDIFGFYVTPKEVFPEGAGLEKTATDCISSGLGWSCTSKIIQDGKISW